MLPTQLVYDTIMVLFYRQKWEMIMFERIDYVVARIDGDYAYLRQINDEQAEEKCVAIALLPAGINEGSRLAYEMLEYTLQ